MQRKCLHFGAYSCSMLNGFKRKSQYESKLRTWNFRKNLSEKEWRAVAYRVQKRKNQNKKTDVFFNNMQIPESKLKKEFSRHVFPTFGLDFLNGM